MAQVATQVETTAPVARRRSGRAARLLRVALDGVVTAYRRSRERQELGRAISAASVGRETGIRC